MKNACLSTITWTVVVATLACLLVPCAARAQSQAIDGTIEGITVGDGERPVAGMRVRTVNTRTGYEREAITDAAGASATTRTASPATTRSTCGSRAG